MNKNLEFVRENKEKYKASLFIFNNPKKENLEELQSILSEKELEKYNSFAVEKRKEDFLFGRFSAKKALTNLSQIKEPQNITISNGVFGQPVVENSQDNMQISIAHSDNIAAAIAFEEFHPVAIDIEKIDRNKSKNIEKELTQDEILLKLNLEIEDHVFNFICWSAKESLSKILKTGFTTALNIFEIEDIRKEDNKFISTYKNFSQYKTISYLEKDYIYSITFPKNSEIRH